MVGDFIQPKKANRNWIKLITDYYEEFGIFLID